MFHSSAALPWTCVSLNPTEANQKEANKYLLGRQHIMHSVRLAGIWRVPERLHFLLTLLEDDAYKESLVKIPVLSNCLYQAPSFPQCLSVTHKCMKELQLKPLKLSFSKVIRSNLSFFLSKHFSTKAPSRWSRQDPLSVKQSQITRMRCKITPTSQR